MENKELEKLRKSAMINTLVERRDELIVGAIGSFQEDYLNSLCQTNTVTYPKITVKLNTGDNKKYLVEIIIRKDKLEYIKTITNVDNVDERDQLCVGILLDALTNIAKDKVNISQDDCCSREILLDSMN